MTKNKYLNEKRIIDKKNKINKRLAELRQSILDENISYNEIVELQNICKNPLYTPYCDPLLLEWGGIKENI